MLADERLASEFPGLAEGVFRMRIVHSALSSFNSRVHGPHDGLFTVNQLTNAGIRPAFKGRCL